MNRFKHIKSFAVVCSALIAFHAGEARQSAPGFTIPTVSISPTDGEADIMKKSLQVRPSAAQLRWQRLELTGFIHFGINTFTGREWGDGTENPAIFNPEQLDARQWARVCRDAGIQQLIITAKHHDGFCLWPSKYTEHSVRNSPWKNGKGDVVKELAEACREYGLGFGVYLSPWDRNSAYFGDSARYNDYFINQLTELLTNYGPIAEVWFDGANGEGPDGKKQVYDFNRWYAHIRKLQPDAVIAVMGPDVRWVGTESGYGRETEWSVLPGDEMVQENIAANSQQQAGFAPMNLMEDDLGSREKIKKARKLVWYPAEVDVSIRPGWFYHPEEDSLVKSPEKLLDIYCSSVGRNAVLLLNLPPDKRGLIHEADQKNLLGWAKLRKASFANNLLRSAKSNLKLKKWKALVDHDPDTYWQGKSPDQISQLEFNWNETVNFDLLVLQEDIRKGQRIESFEVEVEQNGTWVKWLKATTVGYKRILNLKPVQTKKLRINILSTRGKPQLSELGIYKGPAK